MGSLIHISIISTFNVGIGVTSIPVGWDQYLPPLSQRIATSGQTFTSCIPHVAPPTLESSLKLVIIFVLQKTFIDWKRFSIDITDGGSVVCWYPMAENKEHFWQYHHGQKRTSKPSYWEKKYCCCCCCCEFMRSSTRRKLFPNGSL